MKSLPAICRNSASAQMACHIFAFWFESEFVLLLKSHLFSKRLEEKALLLMGHCPAHPSADVPRLKDRLYNCLFALIQSVDQGLIQSVKTYYCSELLGGFLNSEFQIVKFLKTLMLKDIACGVDLA
jgi:hypothetical protein